MKAIKRFSVIFFLIAAVLLSALLFLSGGEGAGVAHADEGTAGYNSKSFKFTEYSVTYDINSDRSMKIVLDVTAEYTGYSSTGFIYDIPVNAGDIVRNLNAYSLDGGEETFLEYTVENEEGKFLSVYMDDYRIKKGETHSYRISYDYAITRPTAEDKIYLNAIGFGSEADISGVSITINLPEGLKGIACYKGKAGTDDAFEDFTREGNTVKVSLESLPAKNGITFDFTFESGALSTYTDMTPYWIIIGAAAVFIVLLLFKIFTAGRHGITSITCFSAEDASDDPTSEMDPLLMGKLIDNHVDKSDVTSLLYYWANKGYIKIDLSNENDIVLIRIMKELPVAAPDYQKLMYDRLFAGGDAVHINDISYTFGYTVEKVVKKVNAESDKLYKGSSMAAAIMLAILGGLVMGLTPILLAMFTINTRLLVIMPMFMVIPVFIVFALTQTVRYRTLKYSRIKTALCLAGIALIAALFSALYLLLAPSFVIDTLPKILLCVAGFALTMFAPFLIVRTEDYTRKLGKITGFKDFIENVEKDKLEMMLEGNPEFYYNVLPYAIVLGVSDIWEKKFESLPMTAPGWAAGSYSGSTLFDLMIFNSLMRNMNINLAAKIVTHHPSSGSSSGFHGSFGGFSGGGHGGGGFRGK